MPEDTTPEKPAVSSSSLSPLRKFNFSKKQLSIFAVIFGLIGVYILYKTFAAGPLVARVEAEKLVMPDGAQVTSEANTSGGEAALIYKNATITGQFTNSTDAVSLSAVARSKMCVNQGGFMAVAIDGQLVAGWNVNSTTYQSYSVTKTIRAGSHSIAINFSNDYYQDGCDRDLIVDRVDFFGPDNLSTTKPTIAFGATSTSVAPGGTSSLIWSAKNATSCAAAGAWSGNKPVQGGQTVGPLNSTSGYILTCTGPGGTTITGTTITVKNATTGFFTGSYYDNPDLTNLKFTRNETFINFNWGNGSPSSAIANDTFSTRWVGNFSFPAGTYDFKPTSDDGVRLYIDNVLVINKWANQAPTSYTVTRDLSAGIHNIKLEYYEQTGGASVNLSWGKHTTTIIPPPGGMTYGIVTGGDTNAGVDLGYRLGVHIARSYDTDPFAAATALDGMFLHAAQKKIELILLIDIDGKGSGGNVGAFAARFGPGGSFWQAGQPGAGLGTYAMRYIEWGNENSFGYKGGPNGGDGYANIWMDAYNKVQAGNNRVKLMAQGEDGGSGSSAWVDGMFRAQPSIGSKVGCWVIHPYGPPTSGMDKLDRMIRTQLPAHGVTTAPVCITEDGISTDNGNNLTNNYNWPTNMTYAQAAVGIKDKVNTIRGREYRDRIIIYTQYASRDGRAPGTTNDREAYFGIYKSDNTEKPSFTQAARDLAAQYPAH